MNYLLKKIENRFRKFIIRTPYNKENIKYQVIYADPPWRYGNKNTGGSMKSGSSSKYPTLSLEELINLDVPSDKNSVLFLWVPVPLLPEGLKLMEALGYKYKTTITWEKTGRLGMGFWWRGQCEYLLFGVKGKIKAFRIQEKNILSLPVLKHSEKPDEFRQLIERATKNMPYKLELFARKKVEGWISWGNEIESDININFKINGNESK